MPTKKKKKSPNWSEQIGEKKIKQPGRKNQPPKRDHRNKPSRERIKESLSRYRRGGREEYGNYSWRETRGLFLWIIIMTPLRFFLRS
jgi:hypothetical protein